MSRLVFKFRVVLAVAMLAVVKFGVFVGPAFAMKDQCLDEAFSATGKPSSIGELARANSFFTWKSAVKAKHGADYSAWSSATERKFVCIDLMNGDNKGKWECTRTAKPCKSEKQVISAKGSCKDLLSTGWGARRGNLAAAREEAKAGWKIVVQGSSGEDWATWSQAKDQSIKCVRKTKWSYQCVATAMACHS